MSAVVFLEHLFGFLDEVIFPALATYALWMLRGWLAMRPPG